jgi:sec-independent protein translocase protein TatA
MSVWHWITVGVIVLILFGGRGTISGLMADLAKGLKSFKRELVDDDRTGAPHLTRQSRNDAYGETGPAEISRKNES